MTGPTAATTSPRPAEALITLDDLLREHGLEGVAEEPMRHDGWSGAAMTRLTRGDGARFVIKRDSLARDWIARTTRDHPDLREALLVRAGRRCRAPSRSRTSAWAETATTSRCSCPT